MEKESPSSRNIRQISNFERDALARRSLAARLGDGVANHAGRIWFIGAHVVWFTVWIGINLGGFGRSVFDPYPFSLLSMIVSLESIFLSLFILMSQNRNGRLADERNHLELQVNLLAEDENTKMLLMLQALCEHHKLAIGRDPEIAAMAEQTHFHEVMAELKEALPGEE